MGGDSAILPRHEGGGEEDEDEDLFGDDFDDFGAPSPLVGEPRRPSSWVEPDDLKLMHRVGRGLFGDVWLATLHNSTEEFDEFHEVAVKMLPLVEDERVQVVLEKFETLHQASQGLKRVSAPRGMSVKNGRACVVLKFYEGSVGDKMARHPGNRVAMPEALRYGADIVRGIVELHSCGLLALNLKPCNFLLDDQGHAVVGEFGTPVLCVGGSATEAEPVPWMGTPNYMAPEQWNPAVRGPISNETDAWGFACSMVEMVSGNRPWAQMTADEIHHAVVIQRQRPAVPAELPPGVHKMLRSCFEYDYRQRPSFKEILRAFASPDDIFKEGDWICVRDRPNGDCTKIGIVKAVVGSDSVYIHSCDKPGERLQITGASRLSLWKDKFRVDDCVRLKPAVQEPRFGWPQDANKTEGVVEGFKEQEGIVLVTFPRSTLVWKADPIELERVSAGFVAGDWVFLRGGWPPPAGGEGTAGLAARTQRISRIGVVHHVESDGNLKVAFLGRETLWTGEPGSFEKVLPQSVGHFIRLRSDVAHPRFDWMRKEDGSWDTGRIVGIVPNGGLQVEFPGRFWNSKGWWADPEEVGVVRIQEIEGIMQKYQHIESMHWAVRPLVGLIGGLAALGAGIVVVNVVAKPFQGKRKDDQSRLVEHKDAGAEKPGPVKDGQSSGNPAWLPSQVATLIFREGGSGAR